MNSRADTFSTQPRNNHRNCCTIAVTWKYSSEVLNRYSVPVSEVTDIIVLVYLEY